MKKSIIKNNKSLSTVLIYKPESGFAMLFTILVVTLVLSIAIGISSTTLKQTILSSLAKDSQIAFYEADTAVECGMYYDTNNTFPLGTDVNTAVGTLWCGENEFTLDDETTYTDYIVYLQVVGTGGSPYSVIVFDKASLASSGKAIVQGRGYNIYQNGNPRRVERALQVTYDL